MSLSSRLPVLMSRGGLRAMRKDLSELRGLIIDDVDTAINLKKSYVGNPYRSDKAAVKALAKTYEGSADWGVVQTGNIVDIRAAFIIGQGLTIVPRDKPTKKGESSPEMDFIKKFVEHNNLDNEAVQDFAKEGELEGRFLAQLIWDEDAQMVSVRFRSWSQDGYTIKTAKNDYAKYEQAVWKETGSAKDQTLEADAFVYLRFAGRVHQPNICYPKVAKCLPQIEDIDKALRDWREINHLFAAPKPMARYKDASAASKGAAIKFNWKTREILHHSAEEVSYLEIQNMAGSESLENEIVTKAKMVSGTTGVPVHFMGLPDLMSNRATAENLMELVTASTSRERIVWTGGWQEIIKKAMLMYNDESGKTALNPELVRVSIPFVTEAQWTRIEKVLIPAFVAGAISKEYLLTQIPGCPVDDELERDKEAQKDALKKFSMKPDVTDEEDTEEA